MNQVLKISLGVFLGLIAAFVAYKVYEVWEFNAAQERAVEAARVQSEEARVEAQKLVLRRDKASKNLYGSLTREKLIKFCGEPLSERAVGLSAQRNLEYIGADGRRIKLEVTIYEGHTVGFMGMFRSERTSEYETSPNYEGFIAPGHDYPSIINELPCLAALGDE